jgi:hypothetical protein
MPHLNAIAMEASAKSSAARGHPAHSRELWSLMTPQLSLSWYMMQ